MYLFIVFLLHLTFKPYDRVCCLFSVPRTFISWHIVTGTNLYMFIKWIHWWMTVLNSFITFLLLEPKKKKKRTGGNLELITTLEIISVFLFYNWTNWGPCKYIFDLGDYRKKNMKSNTESHLGLDFFYEYEYTMLMSSES